MELVTDAVNGDAARHLTLDEFVTFARAAKHCNAAASLKAPPAYLADFVQCGSPAEVCRALTRMFNSGSRSCNVPAVVQLCARSHASRMHMAGCRRTGSACGAAHAAAACRSMAPASVGSQAG